MPTAANWICGSTDGNVDRSAVPVGTISEDVYFRKVLYLSYTRSVASIFWRYLRRASTDVYFVLSSTLSEDVYFRKVLYLSYTLFGKAFSEEDSQ